MILRVDRPVGADVLAAIGPSIGAHTARPITFG
jgi:hypothetical protein